MGLYVLSESPVGFALFKAKDKKLLKRESLAKDVESAEEICDMLKLKKFAKFDSAATALEEVTALVDGKISPFLTTLLDKIKDEKKASLAVADPKLGKAIRKLPGFDLTPISDDQTLEIYRGIRTHISSLVPDLKQSTIDTMTLGLSHSMARHKLKFSPEKMDVFIVHAIGLLDDLDKDINTDAMRLKEWYGWHFPEMGKIINDNLAYARIILKMGFRSSASKTDLATILPEEIEAAVKAAAEVSMGMDMTQLDLEQIQSLAEQVISLTDYRQQLSSHLSVRMAAIAPNLTMLVGELVGARLIAHAGSLMTLSKNPASTIQILGAEKALFRALKTKHDTPKYGLIYHASLIGQATGKNKGKIARVLAAKAALGIRIDALSDWNGTDEEAVTEEQKGLMGANARSTIENRLRRLEGRPLLPKGIAIGPDGASSQPAKFEIKEARKYNVNADSLEGNEPARKKIKGLGFEDSTKASLPAEEIVIKKLIEEVDAMEDGPGDEAKKEDDSDDDEDETTVTRGPSTQLKDEMEGVESTLSLRTTNGKHSNGRESADEDSDEDEVSDSDDEVSDDEDDEDDEDEDGEDEEVPAAQLTPEEAAKKAHKAEKRRAAVERKKARRDKQLAAMNKPLTEEQIAAKKRKKEKLSRNVDKATQKERKAGKKEKRAKRDELKYGNMARKANLPTDVYKRKLKKGYVKFDAENNPIIISKKEKKEAKMEKKKLKMEKKKERISNFRKEQEEKKREEKREEKLKKRKRVEEDAETVTSTKKTKKNKVASE